MPTSVLPAVEGLCWELAEQAGPERSTITEIEAGLAEPLRIAIGGRVSSGKSTLVNALIGGHYAPVRAEETAQVTTVYRWAGAGAPMSCRLVGDDGVVELPPGPDRTVPAVEPDGDSYLEVFLDAPLLEHLELVDTPGLYSADSTGYSEAGRRALSAETARRMAAADAVLFLLGSATSRIEARTIDDLQRLLPADRSGLTVVAVLSRVDQLYDDDLDPFEAGVKVADAVRRGLGASVGDVVGVSGLLACAALPGGLRDTDLDLIRRLRMAGYRDPVDGLFEEDAPAGTERTRGELLTRLERYGIGWAVERAWLGPGQFRAELRERSGIAGVEDIIRVRFQRHADLLKADRALAELDRLARGAGPAVAAAIRTGVAQLRRLPAFHRLAEDRALLALRRLDDDLGLPAETRTALVALFLGDTRSSRMNLPPQAPADLVDARLAELQHALLAANARPAALSGEELEVVRTALLTLALTRTEEPQEHR